MQAKDNYINAIIVDDEKGCILNLQHFLGRLCPRVNVLSAAQTLPDALASARKQKIDLAFLDISLAEDNIFNALGSVAHPDFRIVFVTAYNQYAIKAIRTDALDYILKPLSDEDLLSCYARVLKHFSAPQRAAPPAGDRKQKVTIKDGANVYVVPAEDIHYITAHGFYSEVVFDYLHVTKTVIVSKPINKIEAEYAFPFLFRIHKSHIVNVTKIQAVHRHAGLQLKMTGQQVMPVAKRRANDFMNFLTRFA